MANTIITPSVVAREALMVLRNNAVMANLVYRDYSDDFAPGVGATVNVRKPASFTANEFSESAGITVQDITEGSVPVVMDKLLDVSFAVTSKELTLSIEDFSNQFIVPAMQAFADKVDKYLLGLEGDITNRVTHASGDMTVADVINARKYLVASAAPLTDRRFVYGAQVEADLLKVAAFTAADQVGDAGTALREASLGRKYGMDFYVDQNIAKTTGKTTNYTPAMAFHKNAFALVTRPLALPEGAADASIMNYDGFGLRVVRSYDINKKKDIISIDMLCGVKTLDKNLAAVIDDQR